MNGFLIEIQGEKDHDLISLQVLLGTVEFLVVLEKAGVEVETHVFVGPIDDVENLINELSLHYFNRVEYEDLHLLQIHRL